MQKSVLWCLTDYLKMVIVMISCSLLVVARGFAIVARIRRPVLRGLAVDHEGPVALVALSTMPRILLILLCSHHTSQIFQEEILTC